MGMIEVESLKTIKVEPDETLLVELADHYSVSEIETVSGLLYEVLPEATPETLL